MEPNYYFSNSLITVTENTYFSGWRVKRKLLTQISEDTKLPEANFRRRIAASGCVQPNRRWEGTG
jgi:hypothetical protein